MNERILVVDDTEAILDAVTDALAAEGFEVQGASDGRAGLEAAQAEPFDLVILDLMLPGLSGTEICRRLRAESPVPIIMLTARDAEADRVLGLEIGADDYVTKPFSEVELLSRVRAILRRRELDRPRDATVRRLGGLSLDVVKPTARRSRSVRRSTSCSHSSPRSRNESLHAARSCSIFGRAPTWATNEHAMRTCRRCAGRSSVTRRIRSGSSRFRASATS
jgi:DNA-binding response OmpR family regulator